MKGGNDSDDGNAATGAVMLIPLYDTVSLTHAPTTSRALNGKGGEDSLKNTKRKRRKKKKIMKTTKTRKEQRNDR